MITGQVGLVAPSGDFRGRLTQLVTGSHWVHMIVAVSETHCVSADPGGARVRPVADYGEVCWSQFPLRGSQRRRIVRFALSMVGTPYAWVDWVAAGVAVLTRAGTPEWLRSVVASHKRLLCSQLADLCLQAAGIHVFFDERPAGAVVPASFGRVFVGRGWASEL